jgi:3-methyladenine DNA glycosylase Tag
MANNIAFKKLYQLAAKRKGGEQALSILLGDKPDDENVATLSDDRVLAAFSKQIFKSGFVWRVVENKWPNFERVFFDFSIEKILMMPDEMLEQKASDARIIRNFTKVKTIKANAHMIFDHQLSTKQSFAQFIADWPTDNIIGLWAHLKQHGQRLGGNTGPYALRMLGKDTFILSSDVEAYFRAHHVIDGGLQSKKNLLAIQHYLNEWQQQTGYSLAQLSRLIAFATGDNSVQIPQH